MHAEIDAELSSITAGKVTSIHQTARIVAWLAAHDCPVDNVAKGTLGHAFTRKNLPDEARRVMELRRNGAHAASNKYHALMDWRGTNGRARGCFRFHGASTGRWSGLGPQPQNLRRTKGAATKDIEAVKSGCLANLRDTHPENPLEVVGELARAALIAAPGHRFIAADFSGIEARVLAWLAGETAELDAWAKFDETGLPEDEPYHVTGANMGLDRDGGKTATLAFGFMGGVGAYRKLAPDTAAADEQIKGFQYAWRNTHPAICKFWGDVNRAAIQAVQTPHESFIANARISFRCDDSFLRMRLPSGRELSYPFPKLIVTDREDLAVVFKDASASKWADCKHHGQLGSWPGGWTENAVSAVARDLLAAAMLRLEAACYPTAIHIHDEICAEVPNGFGSVDEFLKIITARPPYAADLPIAAKGRNGPRFCKIKTSEKYGVIFADPPWKFETWSKAGSGRSAEQHYPVMTLEEMKAIPVASFAAKDCVLLMWMVDSNQEEALELIKAWGFTYKTVGFTWVKLNPKSGTPITGMGHHTRRGAERAFLATRGNPKRLSKGVYEVGEFEEEVIRAKRGVHSWKPPEFYARTMQLYPGPYLEMFARQSRDGWDSWGNETTKFDPEESPGNSGDEPREPHDPAPEIPDNVRNTYDAVPNTPNGDFGVEHTFRPDDNTTSNTVRNRDGYPIGNGEDHEPKYGPSYIYRDANGQPFMRTTRRINAKGEKEFPQQRWDAGKWVWGRPAGPKILYRLPEFLAERFEKPIWICEGERDADSVAALGFVATTNSEGGTKGKWTAGLNTYFTGVKTVYIMEDNDKTGRDHVAEVASNLRGIVPEIRIVDFRELPEHGDITEWLAKDGNGKEKLLERAKAGRTPDYRHRLPLFNEIGINMSAPYLVEDFIPQTGLTVFWGPPKCGKSFAVFDLAMHIALGWKYHDLEVRQGTVVYCALEGAEGFKRRIVAFRQKKLADHAGEIPFYLMSQPLALVPDHQDLIASIWGQCSVPAAVVIDTLNRSLTGSESSDEDMSNYVKAADAIKNAFSCAVIIIHHCGHEGTRPRGHSSLIGAIDAQIGVMRDELRNIVTTVEFMKDGLDGTKLTSRLEVVEIGRDDDGDEITSCIVVPVGTDQSASAGSPKAWEKGKAPKGTAKIAHEALFETIGAKGFVPPAEPNIPTGRKCARMNDWMLHSIKRGICAADSWKSREQAFRRASASLVSSHLVGVWEDYVWIVTA